MTYALSQIGSSLSKISLDIDLSLYSLITDINFYVPFFIIFVVFIITNYLYKKIINEMCGIFGISNQI